MVAYSRSILADRAEVDPCLRAFFRHSLRDFDESHAGLIFALAVCFGLALVFGWFDAILYGPLPKVEGKPVLARLALSATLFVIGQNFLAPLIFIVTLRLLDLAGISF